MANKREKKSAAKAEQGALPPTMTTTTTTASPTVTVSVQVIEKKATITAGQGDHYDVDFQSGELITRQDVRKMMAALQRGYNKYLYNLRHKKGAK